MIALLEARRAGLFERRHWWPNVVAGVVVGIVAVPLSMAFAIASGARPEQGLYTAIVGGGLVAVLGGSRLQIAGPTGAFIAVLAGITAKYGIDGLQIATLMAGAMLVLMGLGKLGGVIRYIPAPVIVGFTTGIAVIIFVGEWRDFLGLPKPAGEAFHQRLVALVASFPLANPSTAGLAVLSLLVAVCAPRLKPLSRLPGPLVAMVVATVLQASLHLPGVATIGSAFGGIPHGLPSFHWPDLALPKVLELIGPAFTIAILGAIESLLSAVVADGMAGTRHDSNQELVGQGIANLCTPLFGGFAATGALARTATNIRNGATSPLAGIVHTVTLVAVLVALAPLADSIPLAALAAILFVVAWKMSELPHFVRIATRAPKADRVVLVVTFLLTVFADVVVAVNVGVILATLQFLRRMAEAVETRAVDATALQGELGQSGIAALPDGVVVYEIDGPLFFGAVERLEAALNAAPDEAQTLVVRLGRVPFADITGLQALAKAVAMLQRRGIRTVLCEAPPRLLAKLRNVGLLRSVGEGGYAHTVGEALERSVAQDLGRHGLSEVADRIVHASERVSADS